MYLVNVFKFIAYDFFSVLKNEILRFYFFVYKANIFK